MTTFRPKYIYSCLATRASNYCDQDFFILFFTLDLPNKAYHIMARRRLKGPQNWSCGFCGCVDCLYLPHGFYSLLSAALASMAFWTTLVQDGCDYAKLEGGNVKTISGSDVLPFLEVGISHFRAPMYYSTSGEWKMVYTENCVNYPMNQEDDLFWKMSRWLLFCSSVIGGGVALFLWFSTCFTLSIRTWRFCAVEAGLAAILRAVAFVFFLSEICSTNASSCSLYFGSHMDITAIVLWIITSLAMFGHYPDPKLRMLTESEIAEELSKEHLGGDGDDILAPKRLSGSSATEKSRFLEQINDRLDRQQYNEGQEPFYDRQSITSRSKTNYDGYNDQSVYTNDEKSLFSRDGKSVNSREKLLSHKSEFDSQSFYSKNAEDDYDGQSYHSNAYHDEPYFDHHLAA